MLSEKTEQRIISWDITKKVNCLFRTISMNKDDVSPCLPYFVKCKNGNPELNVFTNTVLYNVSKPHSGKDVLVSISSSRTPLIYHTESHLECPRKFSVRTETNRNKICCGCVSVCFVKPKTKNFGMFWCLDLYWNNWKKQNCFETNRNNPKFSEKYQNMLSIKLFWMVFCLFWFNRNVKTLCFGIEPKQAKQTVTKQTKTNRNNPNFFEKIPKYALYHTVSVAGAETSFGSSFGRFQSKLISKDTLVTPTSNNSRDTILLRRS